MITGIQNKMLCLHKMPIYLVIYIYALYAVYGCIPLRGPSVFPITDMSDDISSANGSIKNCCK